MNDVLPPQKEVQVAAPQKSERKPIFWVAGVIVLAAALVLGWFYVVDRSLYKAQERIDAGDIDGAAKSLVLARKLTLDNPQVLFLEAYIARDRAEYAVAYERARGALAAGIEELYPESYRQLIFVLGDVAVRIGEYADAELYLREYSSLIPALEGEDQAVRLAQLYFHYTGDVETAMWIFMTIDESKLALRDLAAYHKLGTFFARNRDDQNVLMQHAQALLAISVPDAFRLNELNNVFAHRVLAQAALRAGDQNAAIIHINALEDLTTVTRDTLPLVNYSARCALARVYAEQGEYARVVELVAPLEPFVSGVYPGYETRQLECVYARAVAEHGLTGGRTENQYVRTHEALIEAFGRQQLLGYEERHDRDDLNKL